MGIRAEGKSGGDEEKIDGQRSASKWQRASKGSDLLFTAIIVSNVYRRVAQQISLIDIFD